MTQNGGKQKMIELIITFIIMTQVLNAYNFTFVHFFVTRQKTIKTIIVVSSLFFSVFMGYIGIIIALSFFSLVHIGIASLFDKESAIRFNLLEKPYEVYNFLIPSFLKRGL